MCRQDSTIARSQKTSEPEIPCIFENPLGEDDIKLLIAKSDRVFEKVGLNQVRSRVVNRYIDAVVAYIVAKQVHQSCWATTNIEKIALFSP